MLLVILELAVFFLTNEIKNIGPKKGAAIAGWISLWVGSELIARAGKIQDQTISFELTSFTTVMAILVIVLVLLSKDNPQAYSSTSRRLLQLFVQLGLMFDLVMPIILAFLGV